MALQLRPETNFIPRVKLLIERLCCIPGKIYILPMKKRLWQSENFIHLLFSREKVRRGEVTNSLTGVCLALRVATERAFLPGLGC